jgi:hypothetical protein
MDFTRTNLRHLIGSRSLNEVAEGAGIGQTWLQRYMNPEKLSLLASYLGVSLAELMLQDLTSRHPQTSHLTGSEPAIVEAAVKLVQYLDEIAPDLARPETYATRLYFAMQVAREEGSDGVLDGSRFADASRSLAARIRRAAG